MQSHQFESLEAAITYLEERGTLKYWGWEGQVEGYYVYTYIDLKGFKWDMNVYKSGKIEYKPF